MYSARWLPAKPVTPVIRLRIGPKRSNSLTSHARLRSARHRRSGLFSGLSRQFAEQRSRALESLRGDAIGPPSPAALDKPRRAELAEVMQDRRQSESETVGELLRTELRSRESGQRAEPTLVCERARDGEQLGRDARRWIVARIDRKADELRLLVLELVCRRMDHDRRDEQ